MLKTKKMQAGGMAKMATIDKPKKGFLAKGEVPSPDEGYRGKRPQAILDEPIEHEINGYITEGANKDYKEEAGVQDSINNPLVRGARKAATYVKEKYGDIRDDVRTAVTGDDSAKYRGMTRKVREGHLGYKQGGTVKYARGGGIEQRGKTRGRFV